MQDKLHPMVDRSAQQAATPVPEAVGYVRDLLTGFGPSWSLCRGWAGDAWLGRQTRDHGDVDIAVFHRDQRAIFEHFRGLGTGWPRSQRARRHHRAMERSTARP